MTRHITKPIFIVGCGRSGTTLLYDMLCGHPSLAWFSNYSDKMPGFLPLAFLGRFYRSGFIKGKRLRRFPRPSEGYPIWDYCYPVDDSPSDPPLYESDVTPDAEHCIRKTISAYQRFMGRPRFVNKNTRNSRRILFLNKIFPDAKFIHVIRDGRAVTASLLKVKFWNDLKIWFENKITPEEYAAQGNDPLELAARLWKEEVQLVLDSTEQLDQPNVLEVKYEQLAKNTIGVMEGILDHCELERGRSFMKFVNIFRIKNMNYKYQSMFTPGQVASIEKIQGPLLQQLSYQ